MPHIYVQPSRVALVLALAATSFVAGCVPYGSSEAIKPMSSDIAKISYVSEIDIKSLPANVSPEFKGKLDGALHEHLKKCASGQHPLKLQVNIGKFSPQNPALTLLVGDSNVIKGTAQLTDPATNTVVGDFDIDRSVGGGGIIAAIGMAGAEAQTSDAFATELCQQAFGAK